jgi:hypothetical protein
MTIKIYRKWQAVWSEASDQKGLPGDVDTGKDYGVLMISSRSPDRVRSTPGIAPPEALDTGNSTRFRGLAFGLVNRVP